MQRHAERLRLLLVRDRGLDRLRTADDDDPVPVAEQLVERALLEIARREAGDSASRTCSVSIAIVSSSASRSRFATTIGSDGETWRKRPRRAPAGTVSSSVRLSA